MTREIIQLENGIQFPNVIKEENLSWVQWYPFFNVFYYYYLIIGDTLNAKRSKQKCTLIKLKWETSSLLCALRVWVICLLR